MYFEVYFYEERRCTGPGKEVSMIKVTEEPAIDVIAEQNAELLLVDVKK